MQMCVFSFMAAGWIPRLKRAGALVALCTGLVFVALLLVVQAQNTTAAGASGAFCETGCLLPPTGLVGWWTGDGSANDIQLGNNGVATNGASFAPGLVKQAFRFDGEDDFVDVPDTSALHAVTTA